MYHHPKKSYGQHFLTSEAAVAKIVLGAQINISDTIIEIGPGKGVLTKKLLETGANIIAIEKDVDLIPFLKEKFGAQKNFSLLCEDVLDSAPPETSYKVVANIPYYITGAIIKKYLTEKSQPLSMTILIQKEVAERIVAKNEKESLLSLSVKAYGSPKLISKVGKGSFHPIPKVDSAIISINNITRELFLNENHESLFFKVIHQAFAHKRKKVFSNLNLSFNTDKLSSFFEKESLDKNLRAEDVTLDTWIRLSSYLS